MTGVSTAPLTVGHKIFPNRVSAATAVEIEDRCEFTHLRVGISITAKSPSRTPKAVAGIPKSLIAGSGRVFTTLNFEGCTSYLADLPTAGEAQISKQAIFSEWPDSALVSDHQAVRNADVSTAERFARALGEWKGLLAPHHYDAMAFHADRLLRDQDELDEDGIVPSPSSFDDLIAFLAGRPWAKSPAVGLSAQGRFSGSWAHVGTPQSDVTLTFLGGGTVKWYVYGIGKKRTGSAAGTIDRPDLPGLLAKLECDDWMVA